MNSYFDIYNPNDPNFKIAPGGNVPFKHGFYTLHWYDPAFFESHGLDILNDEGEDWIYTVTKNGLLRNSEDWDLGYYTYTFDGPPNCHVISGIEPGQEIEVADFNPEHLRTLPIPYNLFELVITPPSPGPSVKYDAPYDLSCISVASLFRYDMTCGVPNTLSQLACELERVWSMYEKQFKSFYKTSWHFLTRFWLAHKQPDSFALPSYGLVSTREYDPDYKISCSTRRAIAQRWRSRLLAQYSLFNPAPFPLQWSARKTYSPFVEHRIKMDIYVDPNINHDFDFHCYNRYLYIGS